MAHFYIPLACQRFLTFRMLCAHADIMKQQGHFYDVNHLAYSPDGQLIASGGDDGKVKIWNSVSSFCFVTFTEHQAAVTGLAFTPNGTAVLSSSLDGTVRAFDLIRYRNFRTLQPPQPTQLSCVAIDPSGELVCAGALLQFDIFIWNLQTSKHLDTLSGHTAPVAMIVFNPLQPTLASASWDRTVRVWDLFNHKSAVETLEHNADVVALAYRPDGKELCTSTLDGQLTLWDVEEGAQVGSIEGRRDISGGRRVDDPRSADTSAWGKYFNRYAHTPCACIQTHLSLSLYFYHITVMHKEDNNNYKQKLN